MTLKKQWKRVKDSWIGWLCQLSNESAETVCGFLSSCWCFFKVLSSESLVQNVFKWVHIKEMGSRIRKASEKSTNKLVCKL